MDATPSQSGKTRTRLPLCSVIGLSHHHAPPAPAVAAGLNIAGFNGGIAVENTGLVSTASVGAAIVVLGILWVLIQISGAKNKCSYGLSSN